MELSSSSDITATNIDIEKLYILCIISVIFWVGIFVIGAFLCVQGWVAPPQLKVCRKFPKISGAVLVIIVYFIWKIVSCIIRGSFLTCFF